MFIGKYNKAAWITYLGTLSSLVGISIAILGYSRAAIICLVISGVCDMFDGKVARLEKNRTEEDKNYGVQIDSLSDTICFVLFPIVLFLSMGMCEWYNIVVYCIYGLAGIIRLAYFNITTSNSTAIKNYTGLPVTSSAIIFPALSLLAVAFNFKVDSEIFKIITTLTTLIVGILFISKIKIRKPKGKIIWYFLGAAIVFILFMVSSFFWR